MRTDLDLGDRLGPGDFTVHAQPGRPYHTRPASVRSTAVMVPPEVAAEVARNRPDDPLPPLRFASLRPACPAAARCWLRTVDYVMDSLRANPTTMAQPLLAGATARLLAAVPGDGTTVTGVAARWGFFHPGDFAAAYRQVYGRPPSRTLRG
ncbi:AraC family transcriptional regulator [Planobispora takensis]|uniref:HTH araC/xylS-type domain-containing protein n=1 Tax=Planobispora takensis TaxID=1367882 RepID=A0A8J3T0F9_9ACTN|nr:helix-turn-helix transcriptional regulator [Planobispora takensis]GII03081.1 hypothetical protein Pta02_50890 [Planobispora takensis]